MTAPLHLSSLAIEGFRGIRVLELPSLGRVTLLAGNNGVGKSTVLDALRFYASRGDPRVLVNLLEAREEFVPGTDEDGDIVIFPDFTSLFHAEQEVDGLFPARIRSESKGHDLAIHLLDHDEAIQTHTLFPDEEPRDIKIFVGQRNRTVSPAPMAYYSRTGLRYRMPSPSNPASPAPRNWPSPIRNESLGPGMLGNTNLARLWDTLALTEGEDLAVRALRLVVGPDLERITLVGHTPRSNRPQGRRAVAKLRSSGIPIPLKRFGDGANRLLAIALALANSAHGLLFIDEAENGIHYSVHARLWRMVFEAASAADVQVVAATHSWDCIVGFAKAAIESPAEGTLYRLERLDADIQAIPYSEENLEIAAVQGIEVR